jgi:hypothetical protein
MKYWAYMNNVVCGPFEKEKLAALPNFTPASLLCPDTEGGGQANGWKAASTFPEVLAALTPAPVSAPARLPAAESPLMMTMRGTLIEETPANASAAQLPAAAPVKAAESPLMMTMRGTLIEDLAIDAPAKAAPPKETPAAGIPAGTPPVPENFSVRQPDPEPEEIRKKLEHMSAMLVSIGNTQSQLLDRLGRVESAVADMKSLLFPAPPQK